MGKKFLSKYNFREKLIEGVIRKRLNRFILLVQLGDKEYKCHCPSTGRIGTIILENIPCLLSRSKNQKRSTSYTVEAISLDKISEKNKTWIGINLINSNKYIEYFLKNEMFDKMINKIYSINREVKLGNSKIDFCINKNSYLEIKSFLQVLNVKIPKYIKVKKEKKIDAGERFMKHMLELSNSLKNDERGIMLLVYQYDSEQFSVKIDKSLIKDYDKFNDVLNKFNDSGIELWQANLLINETGVSLNDYYRLDSKTSFEKKD